MRTRIHVIAAGTALAAGLGLGTAEAAIVQNGSLEDLSSNFSNTSANYMQLFAGSSAIGGWTVAAGTINDIAWAKTPTGDGSSAADGTFFLDLTGFGADSPNGAIQQGLNVISGGIYNFSIALGSGNNGTAAVTVGSQSLTLLAGASYTVGGTNWTDWSASFVGNPLDLTPTLTIANASPGSNVVFIDNIRITGPTSAPPAVPEPLTLSVFGMGLAGAAALRRRRKKQA